MNYLVRRPDLYDRPALDALLISDYEKHGVSKPPLTDKQIGAYSRLAWVAASHHDNKPHAIALMGQWNHHNAEPYMDEPAEEVGSNRIGERLQWKIIPRLDKAAYLLTATDYTADGPLAAIADEKKILEPSAVGAVHVPLMQVEHEAHHFLSERGFSESSEGQEMIFGDQKVATILMTRKGWLRNRLT